MTNVRNVDMSAYQKAVPVYKVTYSYSPLTYSDIYNIIIHALLCSWWYLHELLHLW